jgi:hypothetical protein
MKRDHSLLRNLARGAASSIRLFANRRRHYLLTFGMIGFPIWQRDPDPEKQPNVYVLSSATSM